MEYEEGKCPKSGSELAYGLFEVTDGEYGYFEVWCNNCDFNGREWYKLVFDGFTDFDGNGYDIAKGG